MTLTVGKHVVSTSLRNDLELILIFLQEESAKELMVMVMAIALSGALGTYGTCYLFPKKKQKNAVS